MRRALFLAITLAAVPAFAQDDDDLPALPSAKPKPAKPKPKPKPKVKPAQAADDDLPALPPQKGDLVVKVTGVKGAKLTIDDREIGLLPQGPQSLTAGEHTITVRRLGYTPFNKKVTVMGNKATELNVSLEASAAVLTVSADVAGAQVFVNGRLAGIAPLIDLEVPPGSIEIAIKKDGYYDGSQTLNAKAGRDYPIEVKLGAPIASTVVATNNTDAPVKNKITPSDDAGGPISGTETRADSTPVFQKWWFWTGVVVAVGLIAGLSIGFGMNSGSTSLAHKDFDCYSDMSCAGWINEPSAIVPLKGH